MPIAYLHKYYLFVLIFIIISTHDHDDDDDDKIGAIVFLVINMPLY